MSDVIFQDAIYLRYKRLHEKVAGEYPYTGTLALNAEEIDLPALSFRDIVQRVHEVLRAHPGTSRVVFQRTERPGIMPFELGPRTVDMLRRDPEEAYQAMNFNTEKSVQATGSGEGSVFSRHVYLRVENGNIEDPLSGQWLTFAYGEKLGWMIRGPGNNTSKWLPLVGLIDDAPEGAKGIERLAYTRWALLDVEELLARTNSHFYLPRPWNTNGPWITREELLHLYNKSKETVS